MSYSTVLGPWIIRGPNKPCETEELLPIWDVLEVLTKCMDKQGG